MSDRMTKQQLIDALRSSGERVASALASLSPGDLDRGRYESEWNGRQILAHMASIEWTYPRLLDLAKTTPDAERPAAQPRMTSGAPQILSYNDRQVEKRAGVPSPT